jgi:hypothetical protein
LGVRPLDKLYLRMRLLGIPVEALFRSPESGNGPVVVAVVAIVVPQLIVVVPPKIPIPVPDTFCTRAFTYLCERRHGAAHQQHRGYYKHQDFRLQRFPPFFLATLQWSCSGNDLRRSIMSHSSAPLYSSTFREEAFSETGLPVLGLLGNRSLLYLEPANNCNASYIKLYIVVVFRHYTIGAKNSVLRLWAPGTGGANGATGYGSTIPWSGFSLTEGKWETK